MAEMKIPDHLKKKYGIEKLADLKDLLNLKEDPELKDLLNFETIDSLHNLQKERPEERKRFLEDSQKKVHNVFIWIKWMSIVIFIIGLFLIGFSIYYYIRYGMKAEVLGLNALGVGEILALLLYKPMQRIQNALGDYQQNMMILFSWNTQVELILLKMDIKDEPSVYKACDRIHKITLECVKTIQKYTESMQSTEEETGKAKPKTPQG